MDSNLFLTLSHKCIFKSQMIIQQQKPHPQGTLSMFCPTPISLARISHLHMVNVLHSSFMTDKVRTYHGPYEVQPSTISSPHLVPTLWSHAF